MAIDDVRADGVVNIWCRRVERKKDGVAGPGDWRLQLREMTNTLLSDNDDGENDGP